MRSRRTHEHRHEYIIQLTGDVRQRQIRYHPLVTRGTEAEGRVSVLTERMCSPSDAVVADLKTHDDQVESGEWSVESGGRKHEIGHRR